MQEAPKIDSRSGEELFHILATDLKKRLDIDADGGERDPLAEALLRVFARYGELIIQRLNRVPEKNQVAFLNVLNVSPIPPVPAQVPLTFIPIKKFPRDLPRTRSDLVVRAGTKVAAAPGAGESEPAVFETTCDLALTNIELRQIVALDPQADLYTNKSSLATLEGGPGEFAFAASQPVEHAFYIGHGPIFGIPGIAELRLRFEIDSSGSAGSRRQTITWWMPTQQGEVPLTPVRDTTSQLTQSGEVVFKNLPAWPAHKIVHREMRWLGCRLLDRLPRRATADRESLSRPPLLGRVMASATWEVAETAVAHAFFNNLPLDLSKDFFPFGERPRFGDVLYLSCDAFAKPQARITLKIKLTNPASAGERAPIPPVSKMGQPQIHWEYWNGRRWVTLACQDGTEALTEDGEVFFLAPAPLLHTTINGLEGCWSRARLVSGRYVEEERFELMSQGQGLRHIPSTLGPPSIQSITVTSSHTVGPEPPECIVTHNNFVFEAVHGTAPFQPFRSALEPYRAVYLGFKVPDDHKNSLTDHAIDLYCHISGTEKRASIRAGTVQGLPTLLWQYWNGREWTEVRVEDGTESLILPGIVSVHVGADIAPWCESSLDCRLYWLRVLWISGEFESLPKLHRLLLNTVPATQTLTLQDELLGSSNGLSNQVFHSTRVPILHDVQLEVREPGVSAEEEPARVYQEEGEDAGTRSRDAQGRMEQIWVRWHEVRDFLSSSSHDRHFVVDRQSGAIRFGDGRQGRIPAIGANNVRLRRYQTGGGAFGNKPAGSITQLRTSVRYVDSVINLEPAVGGQNVEDWEAVRERGARWLRHRERAVTLEDYEDLATLASPAVAKAKCYPNRDLAVDPAGKSIQPGVVSVIIVPRSQDPRPLPELALLRRVRHFLEARRVPDTELVILAPEYVRVSVIAVVVAATAQPGASMVRQCDQVVGRYLHPLTGGPYGRGWEFGQRPYESDFYALLESIRGLEVQSLTINMAEERQGLLESGLFLICAGEYSIRLGL
jgi:hypothetical protein